MKNFLILPSLALITASALAQNAPTPAASPASAKAPKVYKTPVFAPIPAVDLAAIQAALPAKAMVEPKKPRKVLVFWRAEGFVHPSIPYGVETVKQLGEKTGAFTTVSSDDMAMFAPESLKQFDGIVFVSTTQLHFDNPEYRKALLDFVGAGKGVVGIHAASDNFPTWPEGQELMGGVFHGHPWHASDLVAVKLDDPTHPINKGFNNQGFRLKEEIYQITGPYGRDKQRELVSLDMSKPETKAKTVDKDGKPLLDKGGNPQIVRNDNDFPISWIKKEGNGRVFYTSLGHNKDIFFVPQILQHYLDGIQYALGDLPADDVPTAALKSQPNAVLAPEGSTETLQKVQAAPEPPKAGTNAVAPTPPPANTVATAKPSQAMVPLSPDQAKALGESSLLDLPKYNYGDAADAPYNVLEALRKGTPETRSQFEPKLVAILKDPSTTEAAKETICRWLGWMGSEDAVPVLAKLAESTANDPTNAAGNTGGYAVRALATIPVKSADRALVDLLASGSEDRQVAVMSAIGIRGTTDAIPELSKLAAVKSPALSGAAFQTLASFRSVEALNVILKVKAKKGNDELKDEAVINASSGLLNGKGNSLPDAVADKLVSITGSGAPPSLRLSALRVLLSGHVPAGFQKAVELLKNEDYRLRDGAAEALAQFVTPEKLIGISWSETPDAWVVFLKALGQKGASSYLPLFQNALSSADGNIRIASIAGVSCSGDVKSLDTLAPLLSDSNVPVAQATKSAIARLKGDDVSSQLIVLESGSKPAVAAILLSILADRQEHKAIDPAIAAMNSSDPALQSAGCEALSRLATSGDLGKCLTLVSSVKGRNAENFQKAVVRAAIFDPSSSSAATQIVAAFDQGDASQKEILINVLARLEVKEANDKLAAILNSQDVDQRKQAIRALSSARSATSFALLPVIAGNGQSNSEKILALKGYIDTIEALSDLNNNDRFKAYLTAWKLASRDEEKSAIRAAVKKVPEKKIPKSEEAKELIQQINVPSTPTPAPVTTETQAPVTKP
jgi:type 1 glutamine amidotransferase/HEAT repeat protein